MSARLLPASAGSRARSRAGEEAPAGLGVRQPGRVRPLGAFSAPSIPNRRPDRASPAKVRATGPRVDASPATVVPAFPGRAPAPRGAP